MQYSKRILVFAIKKGNIYLICSCRHHSVQYYLFPAKLLLLIPILHIKHLSFSPEWKSIAIRNKICVLTSDPEIILYVSVRDDEYRSRQWEIFCPLQCIHTRLKNCATTAGNFYAASDVLWSHIADVRSLRITENYPHIFHNSTTKGLFIVLHRFIRIYFLTHLA